MKKEDLMIKADKLLKKTNVYTPRDRSLITNMFNGHDRVDIIKHIR